MAAGGRRSSVAERWQLKPEALGSTPGGATFLSCPMPFQRSTDSDGPNCVFLLDTIGLRTMEESRPSDSSPCCDYACDLSYIIYNTLSNQGLQSIRRSKLPTRILRLTSLFQVCCGRAICEDNFKRKSHALSLSTLQTVAEP